MTEKTKWGLYVAMAVFGFTGFVAANMFLMPRYWVWRAEYEGQTTLLKAEYDGKSTLARAEQARQVLVTQAKAELEASKSRAEAIKIVGEMAQKYPEYRNQEFIGAFAEALKEGKIHQIIYIPTEGGIPVLESGRATHKTGGK